MTNWMIYGATGYSGQLIVEEAVRKGLKPIVAGRSEQKVSQLAEKYDLPFRVFDVNHIQTADMADCDLVLNCAGPFSQTAKQVMKACMESGCHYLDITGEVDVFEQASEWHQKAEKAGVVLCPGVGFDVIPTDCLAVMLKEKMPDATQLTLGFDSRSGFSPGTAKTSVEALPQGGKVRANGLLKKVPLAYKTRKIDFGAGEKLAMTIPWGDLATAFRSTEIGNIEVYIPASPGLVKKMRRMNWFKGLLGFSWVQNLMKRKVDQNVKGPSEKQRNELVTHVWGEVTNKKGESKAMRMQVPNGYQLTAEGAVYVAEKLLANQKPPSGYFTPAMLLGPQLILKCSKESQVL